MNIDNISKSLLDKNGMVQISQLFIFFDFLTKYHGKFLQTDNLDHSDIPSPMPELSRTPQANQMALGPML